MKQCMPVYLGSSQPEYLLFENGKVVGFWSCYHQGSLPLEWTERRAEGKAK